MSIRRCPRCKSLDVHRSRRRGLFEVLALQLFFSRPYRCHICYRRYYGFVFRQRAGSPVEQQQRLMLPWRQVFQGSTLFLVIVGVPVLLATSGPVLKILGWPVDYDSPAESSSSLDRPSVGTTARGTALKFQKPLYEANNLSVTTSPEIALSITTSGGSVYEAIGSPQLQRQPVGRLRSSGDVSVDEARVPQEVTVFVGDTVRTGSVSSAALTVPGKGELLIYEQTQVSIGRGRYFAEMKQGTVGFRTEAGAQNFGIQIGNFVVFTSPESEASAEIAGAPDGSARIKAFAGSVGITRMEGAEAVFLHAGQEAYISKEGKLLSGPPPQEAPPTRPKEVPAGPQTVRKKTSATKWIALGVASGGAAAAAAALASSGGGPTPVSPSAP